MSVRVGRQLENIRLTIPSANRQLTPDGATINPGVCALSFATSILQPITHRLKKHIIKTRVFVVTRHAHCSDVSKTLMIFLGSYEYHRAPF